MPLAFDRPLVCPVLVGRDAYVAALDRLLEDVRAGRGQTALISGEAGIGKSRLVATLRVRATSAGARVIQGSCFEGDRAVPYAPFVDALRSLVGAVEPAAAFEVLGPDLAPLLPELGVPNDSGDEPHQRKRRIVESLVKLVTGIAVPQGLVLVVEDLHWSDSISLELFGVLARRLRDQPVLLIGTYRDDETAPGLAAVLSELERARRSIELRLIRLAPDHVEAMLGAIFGLSRAVRPALVQRLFDLTDGNPFFVEEMLRSLVATEVTSALANWEHVPVHELRLPHTVHDAVQRRTQRLSAGARQLVVWAAVTGRRFEFRLLHELSDMDEPALLDAIKELIQAQLVAEESPDTFVFRHALTRQAIHANLLARERRVIHRRIADVLERLSADERPEDLAYHFFEAGNWPKAAEYAEHAGRRAVGLYAAGTAIEHFSIAIDAQSRDRGGVPGRLYRQRALAHETIGAFEPALGDHQASLEAARASGNRAEECQALLDLGFLWAARDYTRTGGYFREALDLARQLDQPTTLASALNRVGNWHANVEQPAQALAYHQEALTIFETVDDQSGVAQTLDLLALATCFLGELASGVTLFDRAIALHRRLNDRMALSSSLSVRAVAGGGGSTWNISPTTVEAGLEAMEAAEEALRIAREIGWNAGECFASHCFGQAASGRGAYSRAIEVVRAGLDLAREIEHEQWACALHYVLGTLLRDVGATDEAWQHAERALLLGRTIGSVFWTRIVGSALIELQVALNLLDSAAELAADLVGSTEVEPKTIAARQARFAQARVALARGDPQRACSAVEALRANGSTPTLELFYAEVLVTLGRAGHAEPILHGALALAEATSQRATIWRLQALLARALEALGRQTESRQARDAAVVLVTSITQDVPQATRADFLRMAHRVIGLRVRRGPRDEAGLSTRERQVALLVGEGMSNRAIADRLVLGERTIESHVSAILAKLRLTNRSQVAAWIARTAVDS